MTGTHVIEEKMVNIFPCKMSHIYPVGLLMQSMYNNVLMFLCDCLKILIEDYENRQSQLS